MSTPYDAEWLEADDDTRPPSKFMTSPDADLATLRKSQERWIRNVAADRVEGLLERQTASLRDKDAELARLREERETALEGMAAAWAETNKAERELALLREAQASLLAEQVRLREGLRFGIEAAEEVLELEEPAAEIADVATSAMRAIRDKFRALLADTEDET